MAVDTASETTLLQAQDDAKIAIKELAKEVASERASAEQVLQATARIALHREVEVSFVRHQLKEELRDQMGETQYRHFLQSTDVGQHLRLY